MLKLVDIKKDYLSGENTVHALKGINLSFREQEFVSILGPSGCGKTTLLNIIGGLDHYTSGDLVINGVSTKKYKDRDWDKYRNHTIGFVFQSYNLISHQTVLANVELALTLSGVSKSERKRRATEALEKVGLGDQLAKKPNQLSGGQMQRVAIARALVNNPDILLADEPTGALDTETSIQVMDLLKEIANEKLVIMVTHNPELADQYSDRIIRLLDGNIIDDSNPFEAPDRIEEDDKGLKAAKSSMGFLTALSLSLTNLMTKKGRTFLTAFAGSIGIIGIALILSLSSGIQNYIDSVEEETLSAYPIQIRHETVDITNLMETMLGKDDDKIKREDNKIYSKNLVSKAIKTVIAEAKTNNLKDFKKFLDNDKEVKSLTNDIQYGYDVNPIIYLDNTKLDSDKVLQVNPFDISGSGMSMDSNTMAMVGSNSSQKTWTEMINNRDLIESQYELVDGSWPSSANECVLVVNEKNQVYDLTLYALGLKDSDELYKLFFEAMNNVGNSDFAEKIDDSIEEFDFDDILGLSYKLVLPSDRYKFNERTGVYDDMSKDDIYMAEVIKDAFEIKLVGIIRQKEGAVTSTLKPGSIAYTHELTEYYIKEIQKDNLVKAQLNTPKKDIFTNLPFDDGKSSPSSQEDKAKAFLDYANKLTVVDKANLLVKIYSTPSNEELEKLVQNYLDMYPTRADKEEAIINQFIETVKAIQSGELDMSVLTNMGVDQSLVESLAGYTDTEITVLMKKTYGSVSDEVLDKMFKEAVTMMVKNAYSENLLHKYDTYSNQELADMFDEYLKSLDNSALAKLYEANKESMISGATLENNLKLLGLCYLDEPHSINIYAKSFEAKEKLAKVIQKYNDGVEDADKISYTDIVGMMMSSVSTIVDIISYVLIAFVSISLVVSSIMIGIITYISVLERTKEIGILRAVGASKKDIKHVFNSESLTIGFVSGALGILVTILLNIPICIIIKNLSGVDNIASLPWQGGLILVLISMFLTFIAGTIPSRIAAKKDPVIALRSE